MVWITPKTDWKSSVDSSGVYNGDRFNAVDYNRIKNNLIYLRNLANVLYEEFDIKIVSEDKTPADYFYADEINRLEDNLNTINDNTLRRSYGVTPIFSDNGRTMDFNELNRLESAILDLYNNITNEFEGRRKFQFNFGMNGGL